MPGTLQGHALKGWRHLGVFTMVNLLRGSFLGSILARFLQNNNKSKRNYVGFVGQVLGHAAECF